MTLIPNKGIPTFVCVWIMEVFFQNSNKFYFMFVVISVFHVFSAFNSSYVRQGINVLHRLKSSVRQTTTVTKKLPWMFFNIRVPQLGSPVGSSSERNTSVSRTTRSP